MGALYYGRVCVLSATLLAVVTASVKVGVSGKLPPYGVYDYEAHRKSRASNNPMYTRNTMANREYERELCRRLCRLGGFAR